MTDEVLDEAWAVVEAKRREWDLRGLDTGGDFTTKILGSKWTRIHKRVAADATVGLASRGAPQQWARQYGLNIEASFAYSKYGEEEAGILALEWCKLMQHFYDLYKEKNGANYEYNDADLSSFEHDQTWQDFLASAGKKLAVWRRAQVISATRPARNPVGMASASSSSKAKKLCMRAGGV